MIKIRFFFFFESENLFSILGIKKKKGPKQGNGPKILGKKKKAVYLRSLVITPTHLWLGKAGHVSSLNELN